MKTYKLKRGHEKLNSSAGNLLTGRILTGLLTLHQFFDVAITQGINKE
jgi:hypothetical protein